MAHSAIGMQLDVVHKHAWLTVAAVVLAAGGMLANVSDYIPTDTVGTSTTISTVPAETPATTITTSVDTHVIGMSAMLTTLPAYATATIVSSSPAGAADTTLATVSSSPMGPADTTTATVSSSLTGPADASTTTVSSSPMGPAETTTATVSSSLTGPADASTTTATIVTANTSASVETTSYTISAVASGTTSALVVATAPSTGDTIAAATTVTAATPEAGNSSTEHAAAYLSSASGASATVTSQSVTTSMTVTSSGLTQATTASAITLTSAASPAPSTTMLTPSDIIIIAVPTVVCGIIVIVVFIGLVAYCHRRRRIPVMRRTIPPMPDRPTSSAELVKLSKPVNLTDFPEYVKQMSADSCFGFWEEYDDDLKDVGRDQTTIIARLEHNLPKNRFTNILPYDHSRVKLFTSGGPEKSDYINANYIPGLNGTREFIATQGPMQSTVDDFWRMVWEQHCKAIVMLTRCTEGIVDKCHHYWPSGHDAITYGDVTVQVTDELEQPHWTVTNFSVSAPAAVSNGSGAVSPPPGAVQSRHIRHFHYTAFPDHRAPLEVDSMLQFTRMVRSKLTRSPGGGPIVVHCSAGVGRSGTYIAIDHLLQQIEDGCSSVDVFGIVREMRMHRMYMVQAEEQYVFIHQIIERELQQRRHSNETQNGKGIENAAFAGE